MDIAPQEFALRDVFKYDVFNVIYDNFSYEDKFAFIQTSKTLAALTIQNERRQYECKFSSLCQLINCAQEVFSNEGLVETSKDLTLKASEIKILDRSLWTTLIKMNNLFFDFALKLVYHFNRDDLLDKINEAWFFQESCSKTLSALYTQKSLQNIDLSNQSEKDCVSNDRFRMRFAHSLISIRELDQAFRLFFQAFRNTACENISKIPAEQIVETCRNHIAPLAGNIFCRPLARIADTHSFDLAIKPEFATKWRSEAHKALIISAL